MIIVAKWTTTCAGCGKVVEKELELNKKTADRVYGYDIWGPGFPERWLHLPYDKVTDQSYLFFHSKECHYSWLEKQGRHKEVEEAKKAVWTA